MSSIDEAAGAAPPPSAAWDGRTARIAVFCAFGLILVARIVVATVLPLTEDEAYYRLWAQHPAFGYFDHPPMIAWWVRAGMTVFGDTRLGIRATPILASVLTSVLVFDLARRYGGSRACGVRAALWYNATITVGLGALLAAPDAPASLFWALTVWCLARSGDAEAGDGGRWWIAAGAAAGLGVLSKYSALFLAPGAVLWLLTSRERRLVLLRPWPWLCVAVAASIASPNLIWNAQHHWMTVGRQFGRVVPPGFAPVHLLQFLILQTLLFGPILAWFVWCAVRRGKGRIAGAAALIGTTSLPFLAYLLLHSLHSQVEEHWPVPLFAGGAVLAALGAAVRPGPRWLRVLPLAGLVVPLIAMVYVVWPTAALRRDPALSIEDWPGFSSRVAALQTQYGAAWVATVSYGAVAQFEAAAIHPSPVIQLDERVRYQSWPVPAGFDPHRPGIVVDLDRRMDRTLMARCFRNVDDLGLISRGRPGAAKAIYHVFRLSDPKFDIVRVGCPSRKRTADQP